MKQRWNGQESSGKGGSIRLTEARGLKVRHKQSGPLLSSPSLKLQGKRLSQRKPSYKRVQTIGASLHLANITLESKRPARLHFAWGATANGGTRTLRSSNCTAANLRQVREKETFQALSYTPLGNGASSFLLRTGTAASPPCRIRCSFR